MKKLFAVILLGSICLCSSFAQSPDSLIKVNDAVYMISGHIGNISLLITDAGVVVVDAGDQVETGKRITERVAQITNKPIIYTILTHYHYDHVGGLPTLPNNVPILAHENTKQNLQNREKENKKDIASSSAKLDSLKKVVSTCKTGSAEYLKVDSMLKSTQKNLDQLLANKFVYPTEIMTETFQFAKGKDTIVVMYKGKGHTNGDVVVWYKNKNVIIMGDLLFNHSYPYIDPIGSISNWSTLLKDYAKMNLTYVPGHGNIATPNDLIVMANYLDQLKDSVSKMKAEGKSLDQMKKELLFSEYESFAFQFFREENIEAALKQLTE